MENTDYTVPAFPTTEESTYGANDEFKHMHTTHGITQLDYFATMAIPAMVANYQTSQIIRNEGACEEIAANSYKVAAAMIEARKAYIK